MLRHDAMGRRTKDFFPLTVRTDKKKCRRPKFILVARLNRSTSTSVKKKVCELKFHEILWKKKIFTYVVKKTDHANYFTKLWKKYLMPITDEERQQRGATTSSLTSFKYPMIEFFLEVLDSNLVLNSSKVFPSGLSYMIQSET